MTQDSARADNACRMGETWRHRQQLPLEYAVGRQWTSRYTVTTRRAAVAVDEVLTRGGRTLMNERQELLSWQQA